MNGEHKDKIRIADGKGVVQGPARARAKIKQARAMELRIAGFRYDDIADELGYRSRGAAFKAVETALRNTLQEAATELRNVECLRIDSMIRTIYPAALKGSFQAVDRTLKLMERKARLLGLDAPAEVRHSGTGDGGGMEITVRRVITNDPVEAGQCVGEGNGTEGIPGAPDRD